MTIIMYIFSLRTSSPAGAQEGVGCVACVGVLRARENKLRGVRDRGMVTRLLKDLSSGICGFQIHVMSAT